MSRTAYELPTHVKNTEGKGGKEEENVRQTTEKHTTTQCSVPTSSLLRIKRYKISLLARNNIVILLTT